MTRTISLSLILIITLAVLHSQISAQSLMSFPHGLGIEIGTGQNDFYWSGNGSQGPFGWTSFNRTDFHLTPNIRLTYQTPLPSGFALLPFVGYNHFGGTTNQTGFQSQYSFHALEFGFIFIYEFSHLSLGAGFKDKLNLYVQYDEAASNIHENYTMLFPSWSDNAGFRGSYCVAPVTFSVESWFGMSNLAFDSRLKVRENHYRFLVGYTF